MRILATGDQHFDERGRFDECIRVHGWIADQVHEQRPALFLSGGDVYERASTPVERLAASAFFTRVAEVCPVVIAKGNHDVPQELRLLSRLKSRHPIIVEEQAGVHYVGGAAVAAVAWPDRASLAAHAPRGADVDDVAREALRDLFRGLRDQMDTFDGPKILLGHFMINGSVTSVGQPLIGSELNIGLDDLALVGADIVISDHIHCPQEWTHGNMPILYTGSPTRTAFGETEEKSIAHADWDESGRFAGWGRIATPAVQMLLLEAEFSDGLRLSEESEAQLATLQPGALCRLRFSVPSDHREQAAGLAKQLQSELLSRGAAVVKLDERVIATSRAREGAVEVAQATDLADKLRHYWALRGDVPPEARQASLIRKLDELRDAS